MMLELESVTGTTDGTGLYQNYLASGPHSTFMMFCFRNAGECRKSQTEQHLLFMEPIFLLYRYMDETENKSLG